MVEHSLPGVYVLYSVELMKRWHIAADVFLAGSGLDVETLADPRTRVPIPTYVALLERARTLSGEAAYGYYLGVQMRVSAHGLLGLAALSASTVREAIEVAIRFAPIITTGISLRLEIDGRHAALVVDEHADLGVARDTFLLSALIGVWQIGQALCGRELDGFADLVVPEPDYCQRLLAMGLNVRFDQPANRLLFDASLLELRPAMADPVVLNLAREQCERLLASSAPSAAMTARVRSLVAHAKGDALSLEHVASAMQTSGRTLKRQLAAEGTSFSALVDAERRQRAMFLLASPAVSIKDVADRLGYANIANFTRAFHRWTGTTPAEHRAVTSRVQVR
jgi:AraC-like DNA-binding protein